MPKYAIGVLPQWKVPMLKIELKVTFLNFDIQLPSITNNMRSTPPSSFFFAA
ncbi:MAG: hypothetical protein CM15mP28_0640 [Pseudomonadota bacterium]|nr:MAG: hypothetical protein CM15mP28_0640 [Pseudomonadota bacterium]